jgi:predicted nucleotide-binding protein (sugar kinase/HSP70/actin superfamily)
LHEPEPATFFDNRVDLKSRNYGRVPEAGLSHLFTDNGVVEGIIEQSGTPYFCFKDLDENKPSGSIKIRVETIDYFLWGYREEVIRKRKAVEDIDSQLAAL